MLRLLLAAGEMLGPLKLGEYLQLTLKNSRKSRRLSSSPTPQLSSPPSPSLWLICVPEHACVGPRSASPCVQVSLWVSVCVCVVCVCVCVCVCARVWVGWQCAITSSPGRHGYSAVWSFFLPTCGPWCPGVPQCACHVFLARVLTHVTRICKVMYVTSSMLT